MHLWGLFTLLLLCRCGFICAQVPRGLVGKCLYGTLTSYVRTCTTLFYGQFVSHWPAAFAKRRLGESHLCSDVGNGLAKTCTLLLTPHVQSRSFCQLRLKMSSNKL